MLSWPAASTRSKHDYDHVAQVAHSIKGSVGTFGLDDFTQPAAELQQLAQQRAPEPHVEAAIAALFALSQQIVDGPTTTSLYGALCQS